MSNDPVFDQFKVQLEKAGLTIQMIDDEGLIHIPKGELTLKISLENVRRNYERDSDETHISDLVDTILSYTTDLPDWPTAQRNIYINLFPNNIDFKPFIHQAVTEDFSKVYVHSDGDKLTWITIEDLQRWNITAEELYHQAEINANFLLSQASVTFDEIEGNPLGIIATDRESLKSALLFATDLKDKVAGHIGVPFYAVIPVRDFCYLFGEKDFDFFAARLGPTVVEEYKESGYPVTTEILKFMGDNVEAVGKYPTE